MGQSTRLLKTLSEEVYFKNATDDSISSTRMQDREVVLRYLAFRMLNYETEYHDNMNFFLEKAMRKMNLMHTSLKQEKISGQR